MRGLNLLYLNPTAARLDLAGIFMAELNLTPLAVDNYTEQLTTALVSGLRLTYLCLLGFWDKGGQNNSPQSWESLLDRFVLMLNEPQLVHIKKAKGRAILTARGIKEEFKTSFGWFLLQPSEKYAQSLSIQLVSTGSCVGPWHDSKWLTEIKSQLCRGHKGCGVGCTCGLLQASTSSPLCTRQDLLLPMAKLMKPFSLSHPWLTVS